nr:MAG TPA: hypothetical protein [Caudoviricetes sp.]
MWLSFFLKTFINMLTYVLIRVIMYLEVKERGKRL